MRKLGILIATLAKQYANTALDTRDKEWHENLDTIIYALEDEMKRMLTNAT